MIVNSFSSMMWYLLLSPLHFITFMATSVLVVCEEGGREGGREIGREREEGREGGRDGRVREGKGDEGREVRVR